MSMRRGIIAVAALAAIAAPARADAKPHHHHDHRPCVSAHELEKIRVGWSRDRIERFTETTGLGLRMGPPGPTSYGMSYPSCRPGFRVAITYATDGRALFVKVVRGGYTSYPPRL